MKTSLSLFGYCEIFTCPHILEIYTLIRSVNIVVGAELIYGY